MKKKKSPRILVNMERFIQWITEKAIRLENCKTMIQF